MPAAGQTIMNCVALLAALLSLLQPLQSTHVFCVTTDCCEDTVEPYCDCGCCHELRVATQEETARQVHGLAYFGPNSPCQCPPDCTCRRPPQPQHPPIFFGNSIEDPSATCPVVGEHLCVKSPANGHSSHTDSASHTERSALKLCAVLCRFTT